MEKPYCPVSPGTASPPSSESESGGGTPDLQVAHTPSKDSRSTSQFQPLRPILTI